MHDSAVLPSFTSLAAPAAHPLEKTVPWAVTAQRALLPYEPVEERRQPRGSRDTHQVALFDSVRAPAQRAFRITLIVAFLLHLPLLPTRLFMWLSILWNSNPAEVEDVDAEVVIPIDFDLVSEQTNAAPAPAPTAETNGAIEDDAVPEPAATATTPKKTPVDPADAGVDAESPDAASETPDAGLSDATADATTDATPDAALDSGTEDAGIRDAAIDSSTNDADAPDASTPIAKTNLDAGSGSIAPAATDAGLSIDKATNFPDAGMIADAGSGDGGPSDAGVIARDPAAVAGAPSSLVGKDPNVKILISGERLRKYELGAMFGEVLSTIPQWQTFIGTSGIDPVKDVNHMLIGGPQLRDSSKVVVVLDMNVNDQKARETINGILKRSKPPGKWLEGTPVPAAMANADRGERLFALVPGKHLVVVMPPEAKDKLADVKKIKAFDRSSPIGIALYMVNPAPAFGALKLPIPNTLKWLRINVIPTDDSGVDVVLEAQDKDDKLAREHAAQLETLIETIRKIDIPFVGQYEVLGKTPFVSVGTTIHAETHVTRKQLILIMGMAKKQLEAQAKLLADAGPAK